MVAQATDVLPLAQAKTYLRLTTTDHDEELPSWIAAAVDAIGWVCDEQLVDRQHTEHRQAVNGRVLLAHLPVARIVGIYRVDGDGAWGPGETESTESGLVTAGASADPLTGLLRVVYVAGMESVPPRYSMAAKVLLGRLWGKLRGTAGGPRPAGQPDLSGEAQALITPEIHGMLGAPLPGIA